MGGCLIVPTVIYFRETVSTVVTRMSVDVVKRCVIVMPGVSIPWVAISANVSQATRETA